MAKRVYDTVLASECDGWVCGETLKKGSLPVDRLELDSFSEAVREQILEIIVGKSDKWTITQAE